MYFRYDALLIPPRRERERNDIRVDAAVFQYSALLPAFIFAEMLFLCADLLEPDVCEIISAEYSCSSLPFSHSSIAKDGEQQIVVYQHNPLPSDDDVYFFFLYSFE